MAASIPILRTLFQDLGASSRRYYGSQIVNDSGSSRFGHSRNGEVIMTVAMGDFQGRTRYPSDGRLVGHVKSGAVVVRQPEVVYSASRNLKRGKRGVDFV